MGQVSILLNGRTYRFDCGEGEEARFHLLGETIKAKLDQLGPERGREGDDRLLVLLALTLADELLDARASLPSAAPPEPAPAARPRKPNST